MDEIFQSAQANVMLVPSIFWNNFLWPDLCDEPRQAILDPKSKTYAAMLTYAKELVSRYQDDPATLLMWEIGNEYSWCRPQCVTIPGTRGRPGTLGTRPVRTLDDNMTTDMLAGPFYKSNHLRISAPFDPNHLVTSGDAAQGTRAAPCERAFPKTIWKQDTLTDHCVPADGDTRPLDVMCIHYYGNLDGRFPPGENRRRRRPELPAWNCYGVCPHRERPPGCRFSWANSANTTRVSSRIQTPVSPARPSTCSKGGAT